MSETLYTDIRKALSDRLVAMPGVPAIAWDNTPYTPTSGTPYLSPDLLMGEPDQATIGTDGLNVERGIYQVRLANYPPNGSAGILSMAGKVRDWFKRGTVVEFNGVRVVVRKSYMGNIRYEDSGAQLPISIAFFTYTSN